MDSATQQIALFCMLLFSYECLKAAISIPLGDSTLWKLGALLLGVGGLGVGVAIRIGKLSLPLSAQYVLLIALLFFFARLIRKKKPAEGSRLLRNLDFPIVIAGILVFVWA